jgi:hypothetical protein
MYASAKAWRMLLFALAVLAAGFGEGRALALTKITEVKISPDSRRVIVSSDGPAMPAAVCRMEGPSKMAVDIPGVELGDVERTICNSENPGIEIHVARAESGVRLVLDFGTGAVPEHKIRNMDNCLMVLLSPWKPAPAAAWSTPAGDHGASPLARLRSTATKRPNPAVAVSLGEMEIKSAEVVDDRIVLKVVNRDKPERMYRIDLRVDLERHGFNSANIRLVKDSEGSHGHVSKKKPQFFTHRAQ